MDLWPLVRHKSEACLINDWNYRLAIVKVKEGENLILFFEVPSQLCEIFTAIGDRMKVITRTKKIPVELWNCFKPLTSEIIYVSFRELQLNSINRLRGDISRLILLASKKCAPPKWNALFLRTNNGPNINMQAHPIVLGLGHERKSTWQCVCAGNA